MNKKKLEKDKNEEKRLPINGVELDLPEILELRDSWELQSDEWIMLNEDKACLLEHLKPSTKEVIVYFDKRELEHIPSGFSHVEAMPVIPMKIDKRSRLEYNSTQRHPIPYCIVKHKKEYFFILREKGGGELRLIGKKGMLGGHVGEEDVNTHSLSETLLQGLKREIHEEAGITDDMIETIQLKGLICSNEGVDSDHLGFVYLLELNTNKIQSEEKEILTGMWINEEELGKHYDSFESWSKIAYNHVIKQTD